MKSKVAALVSSSLFATLMATAQTVAVPAQDTFTGWGPGASFAFGETVTVPMGANSLQSFSFDSLTSINNQSFVYKTYLYAFNPGAAVTTGSALFTSGIQILPQTGTSTSVITPTNVQLTPGGVYIVLVSATNLAQTNPGAASNMGISNFGTQPYPEGILYFTNDNNLNFDSDTWNNISTNAAFTATFAELAPPGLVGYTTSGLTPQQLSIGAPINNALIAGTAAPNITILAGALEAQSSLGIALDQLSPKAFGQFTSTTAANNASFATEMQDNYLATQRTGANGTFAGGNGSIDASALTLNDPSYDPTLAMLHSRMMAWNPGPLGAISDSQGALLGGVDMKDPKDMKSLAAPAYNNPWNFYIAGNVVLAQGFSQNDVSHFDSNTESVTLGTDYRITPNFLVGLAAGYGHTDATLDNNGSSATTDSYSPGFYASYADHGWYANLSGDYLHNAYTQSRVIGFLGQTANSAPEGNEGVANLDGGYDFHKGAWTFGPLAGVQYTHLTVDGYSESGSVADLTVQDQNSDSLRSRLGGRVSFTYSHCGINFTPHLDASWQHEFLDQARGITSQFTGAVGSFNVQTTNPSRDSALADLGLDAEINRTVTVFGDYSVQAGQENYFGQSVQAGVKIGF